MKNYKNILFGVEENVATLTLNKPETLNALTIDMMYEVQDALAFIENDKNVRALVFTGAGRGFCSGQDLRSRIASGANFVEELMDCYFRAFNGIRTCRVPVVTAINGVAAGGGFSLALMGDILIAARSAKFIQVFSRIGLVPDLGSTYLLPKAIGRANALKLMMSNEPLSAEEAVEMRLISESVDDADLQSKAQEIAKKLSVGPTHALMMTRSLVDEVDDKAFEKQFRRELETQSQMRDKPDGIEGVAAFVEKRATQFIGQ
ncbi:MAG: enoyl-CoA hydratase/isomerase family protein [Sneathiella sp.]|nr:enoyl-CoA hydratase/isomerase family protein [Sneathiella sp.]